MSSGGKEYQLIDSLRQECIGEYKTQGSVLQAFTDCLRYGCDPQYLDIIYQRPKDKPFHLGSGRDDGLLEWANTYDGLVIRLRLVANTDILGLQEFMEYHGYDYVTEDRGGTNTILNMERYAAVVSDATGIGEGVGATELEALCIAIIQLRECTPLE
jgi:hypothetical protein